ncbi:MAG: helix-turn-helix transcriptional regulator [Bradyrhizobium sp.]|nr:helix-turn-helix transcriptional regulator [Bradyrhizobium sp.]
MPNLAFMRQDEEDVINCPVARAAVIVGSSWTCLILRDLLLHGARRFQDLQESVEGIAPTTLSERLRHLEKHEVVERRFYSMNPPRAEYVLTQKGRDLGPIVKAMRAWGTKYEE